MKFKTAKLKESWYSGQDYSFRLSKGSPQRKLRRVMVLLDQISQISGHGEITITSYIRKKKKSSYHYKAQAVDFRTKDKRAGWCLAMIHIGQQLQFLDHTIQLDPHLELRNKPNEHFHLEIDDGSL